MIVPVETVTFCVVTANGVDDNHTTVEAPDAPSFVCLEKRTGKLLWSSNLPGKNVMHSQWSHPAYADKSVFIRNDKEIIRVSLAAP